MRAPRGCSHGGRLAATAVLLVLLLSVLQLSTAADVGNNGSPAGAGAGQAGAKKAAQQQANRPAAVGTAAAGSAAAAKGAAAQVPPQTVIQLTPADLNKLAAAAAAAAAAQVGRQAGPGSAGSSAGAGAAAAGQPGGRFRGPRQVFKAASKAASNARRSASKAARQAVAAASKAAAQAVTLAEALADTNVIQDLSAPPVSAVRPQFSGTTLALQTVGKPADVGGAEADAPSSSPQAGGSAPILAALMSPQVLKADTPDDAAPSKDAAAAAGLQSVDHHDGAITFDSSSPDTDKAVTQQAATSAGSTPAVSASKSAAVQPAAINKAAVAQGVAVIESVLAELQARISSRRAQVKEDKQAEVKGEEEEAEAADADSLPFDVSAEDEEEGEAEMSQEGTNEAQEADDSVSTSETDGEEEEEDEEEDSTSKKAAARAPPAAATPATQPAPKAPASAATPPSPQTPKTAADDEYEYEDEDEEADVKKTSGSKQAPAPQPPASPSSSKGTAAPPPTPTPAHRDGDASEYEYVEEYVEYEAYEDDDEAKAEELKANPPSPLAAQRGDLRANGKDLTTDKPDLQLGTCGNAMRIPVPRFTTGHGGPGGSKFRTNMSIEEVLVPVRLPRDVIQKVKGYVMSEMHSFDPASGKVGEVDPVHAAYAELRRVNGTSGFTHPAGTLGPAELALLLVRLRSGNNNTAGTSSTTTNLQKKALEILLSGEGVPPKAYPPTNWAAPTGTPAKMGSGAAGQADYTGPYPIETIKAGWFGANGGTKCPDNYPAGAPAALCGHISLVELDAQMSYKQALAYWATGNVTYAHNAFAIINAWSKSNKELGLQYQNGPLESGWAVAAMAKALELLRDVPGWQQHYNGYMTWTNSITMPSMDFYVYNISAPAILSGVPHVYGNWHSTVAEAWMSVSLLTDDLPRFVKAVKLYNETVHSYLKWGKGEWAAGGRVPGECSETLRDLYHSEFGLGGLLQVAEMAWQQDFDLYSTAKYALVAALELHARILNAGRNEALLPPGFRFVENMPKPQDGTFWKFDIRTQSWWAHNTTSPEQRLSELKDGVKYLVGITWLPTGWEMGYNHFAGRLGIAMPETAKLLAAHPVDFYSFHWGLGTITHADTATSLWREGLESYLVCQDPSQKADALKKALELQKNAPAAPGAPAAQQPPQQQQPPQTDSNQQPANKNPTSSADLQGMSRQELLALLYNKVTQYGLTRKQQLKLAAGVLKDREQQHHEEHTKQGHKKNRKHAAGDKGGAYGSGSEGAHDDADDHHQEDAAGGGYAEEDNHHNADTDKKSYYAEEQKALHEAQAARKQVLHEERKLVKDGYKDWEAAEQEEWEKSKAAWHAYKKGREENKEQVREDFKAALKSLHKGEGYGEEEAEEQYEGGDDHHEEPASGYEPEHSPEAPEEHKHHKEQQHTKHHHKGNHTHHKEHKPEHHKHEHKQHAADGYGDDGSAPGASDDGGDGSKDYFGNDVEQHEEEQQAHEGDDHHDKPYAKEHHHHQQHSHKGNHTQQHHNGTKKAHKDGKRKEQKRVYLAYGRQGKALIRTATKSGSAMQVLDMPNHEQILLTATPLSKLVAQLEQQQEQQDKQAHQAQQQEPKVTLVTQQQ